MNKLKSQTADLFPATQAFPDIPVVDLPIKLSALAQSDPALHSTLSAIPELRIVECFFRLCEMQDLTLFFIASNLLSHGFTAEEIGSATRVYMDIT